MTVNTPMRRLRCAVYTRKSSEEGLDMEFNSLDAQREACEAYITSQKAEGWVPVRDRYDDGGFSGGTLERPGLKNLLALCINGIAIFAFMAMEFLRHPGNAKWMLVLPMAVAAGLGGLFGSHMAHRVGRTTVRGGVVAIGFILSAWYFYKTYAA